MSQPNLTSIWKTKVSAEELNLLNKNTIHESLGIVFTDIGKDYLEAQMPVDQRTKQPAGLLHGGASAVLAETLGSIASILASGSKSVVGVELNLSHLKSAKKGWVKGRAYAIKIGTTLHRWEIKIIHEDEMICHAKLVTMIKN